MIPQLKAAQIFIALGIVATVFAAGVTLGHQWTAMSYQQKLDDKDLQAQADLIKAQAQMLTEVERQKTITREVSNDFQGRIRDQRSRYLRELDGLRKRADNAEVDRQSAEATSAGRCDAAAEGDRLSLRAQEDLVRLMQLADEQTQQLIACQKWVKELH